MPKKNQNPNLQFPVTSERKGKPLSMENFKHDVPSVVREIIQNSLDAASNGQKVSVKFEVGRINTMDIPGIDEYKRALKSAKKDWEPNSDEVSKYLRGLSEEASKKEQYVLFATDNGMGLNKERM